MYSLEAFRKTRISGTDDDPLLAGNPNNPAVMMSNVAHMSDEPPVRQHLYDGGNGNHYLIAEQVSPQGRIEYAYAWWHPADSIEKSLEMAEYQLWRLVRDDLPPSINEIELTKEQVMSIYDKWTLRGPTEGHLSFVDFIATAKPTFGCDGAVTIPWCGMHLLIEKDGYTHS